MNKEEFEMKRNVLIGGLVLFMASAFVGCDTGNGTNGNGNGNGNGDTRVVAEEFRGTYRFDDSWFVISKNTMTRTTVFFDEDGTELETVELSPEDLGWWAQSLYTLEENSATHLYALNTSAPDDNLNQRLGSFDENGNLILTIAGVSILGVGQDAILTRQDP